MTDYPRYAKPEALLQVPADRHALLEASAGTGKTHALEHLVIDLILTERISVREMLVVTFTERAASELKRRVRERLRELRSLTESTTQLSVEQCWVIDPEARERLAAALADLDSARIETMHSFCHALIRENPFATGVPFSHEHVDARRLFSRAFLEVVRTRLLTDPSQQTLVRVWIEELGGTLDGMEQVLFEASRARAPLGRKLDVAEQLEAIESLGRLPAPEGNPPVTVVRNLRALREALDAESEAQRVARLQRVDFACLAAALPAKRDGLERLATSRVPFQALLVERFLPPVRARLERLKTHEGLHDYDDLLLLVLQSLRSTSALARLLQSRFRYVLIDEFQDTDAPQWDILRHAFYETGGDQRPLRLLGDPKGAIYGFRGADVHVYMAAKTAVVSRGALVQLAESYRATAPLVDAFNRIFDPMVSEPFFAGTIRSERSLRAGRAELRLVGTNGTDAPPVVLLELDAPRSAIAHFIAKEIHGLLTVAEKRLRFGPVETDQAAPVGPEDVFVLTRTHRESLEIASALDNVGVPYALYRHEGLFQSKQALHLREVLAAIADPDDSLKRFRAWLTPLFGVALEELSRCDQLAAGHPFRKRLTDWSVLAERNELEILLMRLLEDSGVARRELFAGRGERAITNYRHLVEVLLEEVQRKSVTFNGLRRTLDAYIDGRGLPPGRDRNVMRRESEREVSVMTIHAAKGLEAAVVFVYAFSADRSSNVQRYFADGERRLHVGGRSGAHAAVRAAIEREEREEHQRLLYVALTRARARVYLPLLPERTARLGCYAQLNARLVQLKDTFETVAVPREMLEPSIPAEAADASSFSPGRELSSGPPGGRSVFDAMRQRHAGVELTSESPLKARDVGYPPSPRSIDLEPYQMPDGASAGALLAEILETVDYRTCREHADLDGWRARSDVSSLIGGAMRRRGMGRTCRVDVERLVHLALTTPMVLGDVAVPGGLSSVERTLREVEFVVPSRRRDFRSPEGFLQGVIDLVFEHEGRVYFCDWKSDALHAWSEASVARHVDRNYRVQAQLHTLAVIKLIGIAKADDFASRFGGFVFCFVRGLPANGVHFERPTWDSVVAWREELRAG